jgi:hypothetical protein
MSVNQYRLQRAEPATVVKTLSGAAVMAEMSQRRTPYSRGKSVGQNAAVRQRRGARSADLAVETDARRGGLRR